MVVKKMTYMNTATFFSITDFLLFKKKPLTNETFFSVLISQKTITKICFFLNRSYAFLCSFKIVVIFNNISADFVLVSVDFIENDHNFERTEDRAIVF